MRIIQLFYSPDNESCDHTRQLLNELVERRDDILLVAHDVNTEHGQEIARQMDITSVPTTIVDGNRIIRGVPNNPEQILGEQH